jgi:hypothetical protein
VLLKPAASSADAEPVAEFKTPQLPTFLGHRSRLSTAARNTADPYFQLLNQLRGELGFSNQETALRWLLEQLDSSADLRRLILVLLQEGEC